MDKKAASRSILIGAISAAVTTVFARAFDFGWRLGTKKAAPKPQDDSSWLALITFTAISSVCMAIVNRLVFKCTQKFINR